MDLASACDLVVSVFYGPTQRNLSATIDCTPAVVLVVLTKNLSLGRRKPVNALRALGNVYKISTVIIHSEVPHSKKYLLGKGEHLD